MNTKDAAYKTVHNYPGGSESLAPRIGMSAAVLRNKVNPNNTTHHLTLAEASEIMGVTGDYQILDALAAEHGCVAQRHDPMPEMDMVTLLLNIAALKGELAAEFVESYVDKRITPNERDRMNAIVFKLIAKAARFAQQASAAVEKVRAAA